MTRRAHSKRKYERGGKNSIREKARRTSVSIAESTKGLGGRGRERDETVLDPRKN